MSWFGGGGATSGTSAPAASGGPFSFGLGSSTLPAATTQATGFGGFGTNPAATAPPPFSFGGTQPTTAPASVGGFGGFGLNPTAAPASGFGFGSPTVTSAVPAPTQAPFSFGLPTAAPVSSAPTAGSLFGIPTATTGQATPAPSFGFGAPGTASTPFSMPTATPSVAPAGGFGFGAPTQVSSAAPATSFAFGTTTTQAQTQAAAAAPLTFGLGGASTATTSTAPISTGGTLFGTTATPSFGLGLNTTTSSTPFGAPTTSTAGTVGGVGLGLGLGTSGFGIPAIPASTTAPAQTVSAGLGGMAASSINSFGMGTGSGNSSSSRGDQRSVKELPIPAELLVLVDELKTQMKNEKVKMAEVSRASYRTLEQVTNALDDTRSTILNISNIIQRQTHNCDAFRQQITQDVRDAEMAQMTRETPMALQADNYLPTEYFFRLLADYENRMVVYMREIRKAESSIAALNSYTPVTAQDLCMSLKSVKDSLVVIAAKVKTLHERVTAEVETHRNLLRFVQGDTGRDIFAEKGNDQFNRWDQKSSETTSGVIFPSRITDPARLYMNYMAGTKENSSYSNLVPGSPSYGRQYNLSPPRYPQSPAGYGSTTLFQSPPSSLIFNPYSVTSPPHSAGSPLSLKRTKH